MKQVLSDNISKAVNQRRLRSGRKRLIRQIIIETLLAAAVIIFAGTFLFGITEQKGNDMYPAIRDGDLILYYKAGECMQTEAVVYEKDGMLKTGRIAGGPGARISETRDHRLTVNDRYLPAEPDKGIIEDTYTAEGEKLPLSLDDDSWFILNDDRSRTSDSREFGEIRGEEIRGRIVTVLRRRSI